MRVLITGATGFVGGAIARGLRDDGFELVCLGRRSPAHVLEGTEFVHADLRDLESLLAAMNGRTVEAIVDAAAVMRGTPDGDTSHDFSENVAMTRHVGRLRARVKADYLIKISSIDVYGAPPPVGSLSEATPPRPLEAYGHSKWSSELALQELAGKERWDLAILRVSQVFGPGDRTRKLIPSAVRSVKSEGVVHLSGDGEDLRDYVYSHDVARVVAGCLRRRVTGVFNLGTGHSVSIRQVLDVLRKASGVPFRIEPLPRSRPRLDYRLNVERLHLALPGFRPTPLLEALKATYDAAV